MKTQTRSVRSEGNGKGAAPLPGHRPGQWGFLGEAAAGLGFCAVGVSAARPVPRIAATVFETWIARGHHAGMRYMADNREQRLDPGHEAMLAGADALISAAMPYAHGAARTGLWRYVAAHARGRDYHLTMRRRLEGLAAIVRQRFPGAVTRFFVDSAPVMERTWAALAGLGTLGLNGALAVRGVGPRVLLGEIAVGRAPIPASADADPEEIGCARCGRCREACPTGALLGDGTVDSNRCLAYHTVEKASGPLPDAVSGRMELVFGCDRCVAACPLDGDSGPPSGLEPPPSGLGSVTLAEVIAMAAPRLSPMLVGTCMERSGSMALRRNAAIVSDNAAAAAGRKE